MSESLPNEYLPLHGGQLRQIADRFGIDAAELLDFSANINPEGPPAAVVSRLHASLDHPATLTSYPDIDETELKRSMARYIGASSENIVVANGFVPLLEAALRVLPIRKCLLPVPAFVEYRRTLTRAQVEIVPHALNFESGFRYDLQAMLKDSHDAILLANPQNPSGVLASRDVLLQLTAAAAAQNTFVLLDEAFVDYCPDASLVREVDRFPNLIVFRSITKFFGMPGLRVAYAVSNPELSRRLQEAIAPWPITTLASLAASAAVEDELYAGRTIALNDERRIRMREAIEALGVQVYASAANFLLLCLPDTIDCEDFWKQMILNHRIVLRNCANYEGLPDRHLRAAVSDNSENSRLVEALNHCLRHSLPSARVPA
jgi:threonine-phosphate decarboxylase